MENKKIQYVICPECNGDGKETCTNPDHGFINSLTWTDVGRLGCPCCGHDPYHKVPNGGNCNVCNGTGKISINKANDYINNNNCDIELIKNNFEV